MSDMHSRCYFPREHQKALQALAQDDRRLGIKRYFEQDSKRVARYSYQMPGFHLDLSKTHISQRLLDLYGEVANHIQFTEQRRQFRVGEGVNVTESRSVLHHLLRSYHDDAIAEGCDESRLRQAATSQKLFFQQAQAIVADNNLNESNVENIIHIGIGGSSLGPKLLLEAVPPSSSNSVKLHFLANIDGHELDDILGQCDPLSTLVVVVSKSFTTAETLLNLNTILAWFKQQGEPSPMQRVYGVTANQARAVDFGLPEKNIVDFPEWVGGRYSVWSSVSLSVVIAVGLPAFEQFLEGAHAVDRHFFLEPAERNCCYITAVLDHYYRNSMEAETRAVFPYDYRLRSLVDYLQQLETESNGKDCQRNGKKVDQFTSPIVWGGVGTNVQHSVFQLLHQGTSLIPSEFLLVKNAAHEHADHHCAMQANALAQSAALLKGQGIDEVFSENGDEAESEVSRRAKVFSGNRPSTTLLIEDLTPYSLGALIAFYEHRTYCSGLLTNINSFDQMGVELGKRLAKEIKPILEQKGTINDNEHSKGLDASTQALIKKITT